AGVKIPAGAKLLIVSSSANHDERHFADADLFDIRRENASDQLTFGYGSHQCMGKNLARMEMQIFLEEFTRRLPHMKLSEQRFTYVPNTSFRGPEHLWVEWDPRLNPERRRPELLQVRQPVRIGEPSAHAISRTVVVEQVAPAGDGIVRLRLASCDGRPLPRWAPGSTRPRARPFSLPAASASRPSARWPATRARRAWTTNCTTAAARAPAWRCWTNWPPCTANACARTYRMKGAATTSPPCWPGPS